jgi:hypothetical protein
MQVTIQRAFPFGCMMKRYQVMVIETHLLTYFVDAKSEDELRSKDFDWSSVDPRFFETIDWKID